MKQICAGCTHNPSDWPSVLSLSLSCCLALFRSSSRLHQLLSCVAVASPSYYSRTNDCYNHLDSSSSIVCRGLVLRRLVPAPAHRSSNNLVDALLIYLIIFRPRSPSYIIYLGGPLRILYRDRLEYQPQAAILITPPISHNPGKVDPS